MIHPVAGRTIKMEEVSLKEIVPCLPLEVWEMIFLLLPIREKLSCSEVIKEFRDFYLDLLSDFEKYVNNFRNKRVERAALLGVSSHQIAPHGINLPNNSQTTISFSIYLQKSLVGWLENSNQSPFLPHFYISAYMYSVGRASYSSPPPT